MGAFAKEATPDAPASLILLARGVFAVIVLGPLAFLRLRRSSSRNVQWLILRALAGASAIYCYYWTLSRTTLGPSRALAGLSPLLVVYFTILWGGERLSIRNALGIGAMVLGAILLPLVSGTKVGLTSLVVGVGLLGSTLGAIAFLALGEAATRFSSSTVVASLGLAMVAVSFGIHDGSWSVPNLSIWGWVVGAAAAALLGQLFMTASFAHLEASTASALSITSLPFSVLLDFLVTSTRPSAFQLLAYSLIGGGALSLQYRRRTLRPLVGIELPEGTA
jgi:drug/metabolite transporter (DMT)-like permease